MSQESAIQEEIEDLREQLAESKQRGATLTLERDAALNALGIARKDLKTIEHCAVGSTVHFIATMALAKISDPGAALAERDRAIREDERRKIADWIRSNVLWFDIERFCREFNLEPKPEDE